MTVDQVDGISEFGPQGQPTPTSTPGSPKPPGSETPPAPHRAFPPPREYHTPAEPTRAHPRNHGAPSRTAHLLNHLNDASDGESERPEKGLRRLMYDLSNGRINPGPSKAAKLRSSLIDLLSAPLPAGRVFYVGCFSQKGGVGKTTTATALGATMGTYRDDKILGLDLNPDGGSMALRVPQTTPYTILDLRDRLLQAELSPMEFDRFVNHNPKTRFDAIVMPPGEKPSNPLTAADYDRITDALHRRYPYRIVFVDCGTNLTSSVMDAVIPRLDLLVTVCTTTRDEATVTMGGLDSLADEGHSKLVANSVTMMVHKQLDDPNVQEQRVIDAKTREIRSKFREITRAVIDVPYDSVLRRGEVVDLSTISDQAQMAHLRAAAEITTALSEM